MPSKGIKQRWRGNTCSPKAGFRGQDCRDNEQKGKWRPKKEWDQPAIALLFARAPALGMRRQLPSCRQARQTAGKKRSTSRNRGIRPIFCGGTQVKWWQSASRPAQVYIFTNPILAYDAFKVALKLLKLHLKTCGETMNALLATPVSLFLFDWQARAEEDWSRMSLPALQARAKTGEAAAEFELAMRYSKGQGQSKSSILQK